MGLVSTREGRGAFDIISPRIGMIGCGKWGVDPRFSWHGKREPVYRGKVEGEKNWKVLIFGKGGIFGGGGIE